MASPKFDPTINLGHILSAICLIAALGGGWFMFDYRLSQLEKNMERLSSVIVENARFDERLKALERRP